MANNSSEHAFSEDELLRAAQEGSEEASAEVYGRLDHALAGFIFRYLKNSGCTHPQEHTDETRDRTWTNIVRRLQDLRGLEDMRNKSNLFVWMIRVARTAAVMHLRECLREQGSLVALEDEPAVEPDPDKEDLVSLPVEELSDEEVLALTELRLTDEQQAALDDLLARNQEGTLDAEGQRQLDELMRLYEHGLLRKSQALRVAVERELIEPLQQ
jgi:DNA-directed RNA polymerase specialized sigma24 family protein